MIIIIIIIQISLLLLKVVLIDGGYLVIDDDAYLYNISLDLEMTFDSYLYSKEFDNLTICQQYIDGSNTLQSIDDLYVSEIESFPSFRIIYPPQTHVVNCSDITIFLTTNFISASSQNNTNIISLFYKNSLIKLYDLFTYTHSIDYKIHINTFMLPSSTFYTTEEYTELIPTGGPLVNSTGTNYINLHDFWRIEWWQEWNAWKTLALVAGIVFVTVLCIICCFIWYKCTVWFGKHKNKRVQKISTYDTDDDIDDDIDDMQDDMVHIVQDSISNAPKFKANDYDKVQSYSEMDSLSNAKTNHSGSPSKLFKKASKLIAKSPGIATIDEPASDAETDMSSLYDDISSIYHNSPNNKKKTKFTMNIAYAPINTLSDSPLIFNKSKRTNSAGVFELKENTEIELTEINTPNVSISNVPNPNERVDHFKYNSNIQGIGYMHPPIESVIGSLPSIPPSMDAVEGFEENLTNKLIMKHIIQTSDEVDCDKIFNDLNEDVKSPITTTEIAELSLKTHSRSSRQFTFVEAEKHDDESYHIEDISNMKQIHIDSPHLSASNHAQWDNDSSDDLSMISKEKALMDEIVKRQNYDDYSYWNDDDILNVSLIQEIIRNENEWRNKNNNDDKQSDNNKGDDNKGNNGNNNSKSDNDEDIEGDDEKMGEMNEDRYGIKEIEEIQERANKLKQHNKYKLMKKHNRKLTHLELIALIYYTESNNACNKMKDCKAEKWKELYFHITNGIIKMYEIFHYENDKQKQIKMLFHGSNLSPLDELSQQQCFLKTLINATTRFKFAESFATNIILILDNVYDNLYNGRLKAADIGWISKGNEREYIILPTTYCNWKEMKEMEIKKHIDREFKRIKLKKISVYITNDYISNADPFRVYSDLTVPMMKNDDNNNNDENTDKNKYEPVMDWFVKDVRLLKDDTVYYFNKFIDDGYDRLEGIADMNVDDLKDIGIIKKGHIKAFIKAINKLKLTPSNSLQAAHKYSESISHSSQLLQVNEINELNLNINQSQKQANGLSLTSANAAFGMLSANNDESM